MKYKVVYWMLNKTAEFYAEDLKDLREVVTLLLKMDALSGEDGRAEFFEYSEVLERYVNLGLGEAVRAVDDIFSITTAGLFGENGSFDVASCAVKCLDGKV